jgi:outer membrane protein with beta-barrel domain
LRISKQIPREGAIVRKSLIPLAAAVTFIAASALAQTPGASPRMPDWDANFSIGVTSNSARDEGRSYGGSTARPEARVDVGHYWTPHLKTEASVAFLGRWDDYEFESFPVPGLPGGGYASTTRSIQMTTLTPAFTYQFFENELAHPYVSGGARIGLIEVHSTRQAETHTQNRISYSVSALDSTDTRVIVRPVIAAGYKSYFNKQTFLRTELQTSLAEDGRLLPALRIGFGFDF